MRGEHKVLVCRSSHLACSKSAMIMIQVNNYLTQIQICTLLTPKYTQFANFDFLRLDFLMFYMLLKDVSPVVACLKPSTQLSVVGVRSVQHHPHSLPCWARPGQLRAQYNCHRTMGYHVSLSPLSHFYHNFNNSSRSFKV